ncbi:protein of unknown function [Burkholderia multivorans]
MQADSQSMMTSLLPWSVVVLATAIVSSRRFRVSGELTHRMRRASRVFSILHTCRRRRHRFTVWLCEERLPHAGAYFVSRPAHGIWALPWGKRLLLVI